MRLHLLRHGDALFGGSDDQARVLSPKGEADIQKVGEYLKQEGARFDAVYASPYKRTQQTAEIIGSILKFTDPVVLDKSLIPGITPGQLLEKLELLDGNNFLLITHQPLISRFMGVVLENNAAASYQYPMNPGSYAVIDLTVIAAGCGLLRQAIHPESL
ncbi:MAG: phosphohistidine phosphatase SixA [Cellvibrionales bacterium]|nr:phosphohistidine phosphatase SixA [Cellvibrionales bacterium]